VDSAVGPALPQHARGNPHSLKVRTRTPEVSAVRFPVREPPPRVRRQQPRPWTRPCVVFWLAPRSVAELVFHPQGVAADRRTNRFTPIGRQPSSRRHLDPCRVAETRCSRQRATFW